MQVKDGFHAHFIGIGGAGMSGIALVLHQRGFRVTGSDLKSSRYSRFLESSGIPVSVGHTADNLGEPDVVVVSTAIPATNPELAAAQQRGIPVWQRARMLAELAGDRRTIAVAGTHGKTTTSSMAAVMLSGMGLDPTFLIGGEVDGFDTNAVNGTGEYFVVEADESDGSFIHLTPSVAIVTNVEADHLDHYDSLDEIEQTFSAFFERVEADGVVIACGDHEAPVRLARESGRRVVTYGRGPECDIRCEVLGREGMGLRFSVTFPEGGAVQCVTPLPGVHMVVNATAVLALAWVLGLDTGAAARALSSFSGVRRRFDLVDEVCGVTIVDDYAHHPTEVAATLAGARSLGFARVWAVFQPHRYSRTRAFAKEFGACFDDADRVVLMDVYSAGEIPIPGVGGRTVLESLLRWDPRASVAYLPHRADIPRFIAENVRPGDLVMTMGAGDVTALGREIASLIAGSVTPAAS